MRTLLGDVKLNWIKKKLRETKDVPGDVIEVGVYQGGCLYEMYKIVRDEWSQGKTVFGYDTFEGLPNESEKDEGTTLKQNQFYASLYEVTENLAKNGVSVLSPNSKIRLIKGMYPHTNLTLSISFAHLDVDFYQSTFDSLMFIGHRLSPGGIIVCDDYNYYETPGVTKAVHTFKEVCQDMKDLKDFHFKFEGNQAFITNNGGI